MGQAERNELGLEEPHQEKDGEESVSDIATVRKRLVKFFALNELKVLEFQGLSFSVDSLEELSLGELNLGRWGFMVEISEKIFQNLLLLPAPTRASGNLYWGVGCLIKLTHPVSG